MRLSRRLTESPVCLVADDNAVDMNMEKVLKIHQKYDPETKRVLEINPNHAGLSGRVRSERERRTRIRSSARSTGPTSCCEAKSGRG